MEEPGRGAIRTHALPALAPGQVRVRALASAISRGTESLVFAGRIPPSEHQRMRAPFQEGDFPAPVKYGYANVGRIEEVAPLADTARGDGADVGHMAGEEGGDVGISVGTRVFCLYPHQDHYIVDADRVLPVPDTVPDHRATLAANMETAVNALWDAGPRVGDRIAVIGGGVVGLLCAYLAARIPGTRVQVIDVAVDQRRDVAAALDLALAAPDGAMGDVDLVIHASGHPDGLRLALELAAFEATVVELSWFGSKEVSLPLGGPFHSRRLRLQSSQVGAIAPSRRARRSYRQRMATALSLLKAPCLDALISGTSPFNALPEHMPQLTGTSANAAANAAANAGSTTQVLCHVVEYED